MQLFKCKKTAINSRKLSTAKRERERERGEIEIVKGQRVMNIWSGIELGAMKFVALFINNGESLSESL